MAWGHRQANAGVLFSYSIKRTTGLSSIGELDVQAEHQAAVRISHAPGPVVARWPGRATAVHPSGGDHGGGGYDRKL